jgi:AraC family transcriptional regulator, arabinose operon regulatory protein
MKKQDGFPGQISFVLPEKITGIIKENPLVADLYLTDIGYYPQASHHFRERPTGSLQDILIYNIGGQGEIWLNETRHEILPDHFFIIPAGTPHSYRSDNQNPWSIYWIHFAGKKAELFSKYASRPYPIERSKLSRISERTELFSEIFRNLDRGFSYETLEYVNLCLGHLLASFTHLSQFREMRKVDENDPVSQSINFMLEHLSKKLKLEEIAAETGLSASHYSRLFLNRTGHSPIDYFIQLKIQRGCRLLDNSGWSIADVSREAGFDDQFYFSRVFRKVMGMSPAEYRKRGI